MAGAERRRGDRIVFERGFAAHMMGIVHRGTRAVGAGVIDCRPDEADDGYDRDPEKDCNVAPVVACEPAGNRANATNCDCIEHGSHRNMWLLRPFPPGRLNRQ